MNFFLKLRFSRAIPSKAAGAVLLGIGWWLAGFSALEGLGQVHHFEISPIPSPQHVSGFYPSILPIPITVTARASNGAVALSFNGEVALTGVLNGMPDHTYTFEEGNLGGWTRVNPNSSYAVTSFDVNGDGRNSLALDMRLDYGFGCGIAREVFLHGGVPYTLAINSALNSDQTVFYGGPPVRWSLRVGTDIVAEHLRGLGTLFPIDVQRVGLSGTYVPPTNGFYPILFVFDCPFAESRVHIYADDFRVGYASLWPPVVSLVNGQGTVGVTADRPVSNLVLRATDAQLHTGASNPFDILPTANLNLYTFVSAPARVGEDIVYRDVVLNFGPSGATDVRLTNALPAGLTIVSAIPSQGACTNTGGVIQCNLGSIAGGGGYQELVITARAASPGGYTNLATARANEFDPDAVLTTSDNTTVISVVQPYVEVSTAGADESAGLVRFALKLRGPSTEALVVAYSTSNLTALAGVDYLPASGQVEFAPGETNKEIVVSILEDPLDEDDEAFAFYCSHAAQEATMAIAIIQDDDPLPAISISDVSGVEGGYTTNDIVFILSLNPASGREVSVRFSTADGTAIAGSDYLARTGLATFAAGATQAFVTVQVRGNTVNEPDELFFLDLGQPTNAILSRAHATAMILNDDVVPGQLEHFAWGSISSPQAAQREIFLQISALDALGNPVPGFNGTASVAVLRRSGSTTAAIRPAIPVSFANGIGTLGLILTNSYSNVVCRVDDGMEHIAESNPFDVLVLLPMALVLPVSASEGSGMLADQGRVILTFADDRDVVVALQSGDASEVEVPPGVLIPAGQTTAVFNVTIVDDADFDGTRDTLVTAGAPYHASAWAGILVHDNEPGILSVSLPASVQEGKAASIQGRVEMNFPVAESVLVALASSDTTELVVPNIVIISAGQTGAFFNVQGVDDNLIDGPQMVTVTARVTNWTAGAASTVVEDNEPTNIVVEYMFQGPFDEGRGTISTGLRVRASGVTVSNLEVNLTSSDPGELTVPSSVVIAAGQSSAVFPITIVDDLETDGPQPVTVTAAAPGFSSGSLSFTVRDNDVHHFDFAPFSTGNRTSTVPFSVSFLAKDVTGATLFAFTGPVRLSAVGDLGFVALQPTNATALIRGSWSGMVTITNGAHTNVRLLADDGLGHTGQSAPFTVHASPAQECRIISGDILGADVHLQFSTVFGRRYRVEAATDLGGAAWNRVVAEVTGSGAPMTVVDGDGVQPGQRFYRIVLQP